MSTNSQFKHQKSLGQNFLRHPEIAEKIAAAGNITKNDTVVEIGPGLGILTEYLAKSAGNVIAIELDKRLQEPLEKKIQFSPNVTLIFENALTWDPPKTPYKIIANIPYSITSPLLNHFIKDQFMKKNGNTPTHLILMVQQEVAKKICATPPDMNVLALNVQTFGKAKYRFAVSKNAFIPQPKVESGVIEIEIYDKPLVPREHLEKYFSLISIAFSQKRKMLGTSLKKYLNEKSGIDPKRRPETLTAEDWKKIIYHI